MYKDLLNDYNFLMVCNDYIVSILEEADKKGWANTKLELKEKDKKNLNQRNMIFSTLEIMVTHQ